MTYIQREKIEKKICHLFQSLDSEWSEVKVIELLKSIHKENEHKRKGTQVKPQDFLFQHDIV